MNIFIVEDDINIVKIFEKIIFHRELGHVIGFAQRGNEGLEEIQLLNPDIVLVDLLMPGLDGLSLVKEAKITNPDTQFIMISQVSSKTMIEKAYQNGVEFFIQKPINAVEIENVIKKVCEKVELNRTLNQIQKLFNKTQTTHSYNGGTPDKIEDQIQTVKNIMLKLGVTGEAGSKEILDITSYLLKNNKTMGDYTLKELCQNFSDSPKSMEQKIRRALATGMSNIASIGLEDYMNDTFVEYSNSLYNFEQVKKEMDYMRKKTPKRGTVNIKKFIDGLISYCEI
ncbi:response regulator [Clostridium sp.]|uniref:response regulator n=1 Tax=Clostridium sp. TaxID=1506 RepID=UPI002FCC9C03